MGDNPQPPISGGWLAKGDLVACGSNGGWCVSSVVEIWKRHQWTPTSRYSMDGTCGPWHYLFHCLHPWQINIGWYSCGLPRQSAGRVEGFLSRATSRTNLRLHYLHQQVEDKYIILNKGTGPLPWWKQYGIFLPQETLTTEHLRIEIFRRGRSKSATVLPSITSM